MSVEVRPRRAYNNDSIRRHSLNMALMSDVSSRKPSKDSLCSTEHIRQVSLEEHLQPIDDKKESANYVEGLKPEPGNSEIEADSGRVQADSEVPLQEEDVVSNAESFDLKVLQMSTSRTVGRSLANQLVAESLNIEPDDSSTSGEIVAGKVPTVSDIPRPSIVSESDIVKVNGGVLEDKMSGEVITEAPEEESQTEIKTSPPTKDVYALVETSVNFKVKSTPVKAPNQSSKDAPTAQISPIYSKVIKTVSKSDETRDPLLVPEPPDSSDRPPSLALTQEETREVMDFINSRINSRSQLDVDSQAPGSGSQLNVDTPGQGSKNQLNAECKAPISLKEVETATPENDLNEEKADANKPKLSFLNKLKKSFKSCSSDKNKSPNIPQLSRPPSSYIGSQVSLNGSVHSLSHRATPPEKPQTPVLELLSKNPEMCSQDSLNRIARLPEMQAGAVGEVRAVMSDPDLAVSTSTGRSRSAKRDEKPKRRSRSRSLSKLIGDMARKAKSLTEVSPIPRRSEDGQKSPPSARYVNDLGADASPAPPIPLSPPPPLPQADTDEEKPEKKRLSLVGRIKRHLSIGKGDKAEKAEKTKELSKSTPVLNQNPPPISALPKHVKRAKSTENISTTSSTTTTTDVRTQIVLKSAKINKGCRCQVCSLVRRNIRSHCGSSDPNSRHKYEVVLKMNLLGGDFMNSECASIASYQGYEIPDEEQHTNIIEGCIAENIEAEIGSIHSGDNQLRTKTGSEIQDIVQDFQQETRSVSSHHSRQSSQDTDNDLSEIRNVISSPTPRQSAV